MTLRPWIEHDKRVGKFLVRWRDTNGKKHRDEFTWEKRSEANKRMEILVRQNQNNALGYSRQMEFTEAATLFMKLHGPRLANDHTRHTYESQINQLKPVFGSRLLSEITYQDIATYWDAQAAAGLKRTTIRKRVTLMHNLYERFKFWNGMVPGVMPEKVSIPELNPASVAMEFLGNRKTSTYNCNRKRRIGDQELRTTKTWCLKNDPELWKAIESALWTALRKGDQKKLRAGESVNIIQEKTGKTQIMPITLRYTPDFGDLSWRWDRLRAVMGWLKAPKGEPENPLHTTWHDLRHCAPSWMADGGFSKAVIAQYLGDSEKMAEIYTQPYGTALIPAVKFIEQKLEAL